MEGIPVLREQIEHYDLMCKIDLKDAYVILGLKEVQETKKQQQQHAKNYSKPKPTNYLTYK